MNLRAVAWLLGCVLLLLAGFMLVPALVAAWYGEEAAFDGCLWAALVTAVCGGVPAVLFRGSTVTREGRVDYFRREGLAVVGLAWLFGAVLGALPFVFSGVPCTPVEAFFESASGFTTTGSTIFPGDVLDALPRGITFWRAFTHWLGGIGIVLVFVVLFPTGGRSLFRSEVAGVSREAMQQRVRDSALGLLRAYVGLTVIEVALLWYLCRGEVEHPLFEAVVHSFATVATGGFSSHSTSVLFFASWKVELVIVAFMFLAGMDFAVYDTLLRQGWRAAWRSALASTQIRAYAGLALGSTLSIALVLWFWGGSNGASGSDLPDYSSLTQSLRDSLFAVVTMQSCTGFSTADFDRWPDFCRLLLILLVTIGACSGSTGGGIKVVRFVLLARFALQGLQRFARPRAILQVRMDGSTVDEHMLATVMSFCGLWFLVFVAGTLIVAGLGCQGLPAWDEQGLVTAASGVIACLNNAGPGLAAVGPWSNYALLPELSKLLLGFLMILGRLEFYALGVLLAPRFWRQ